MDDKTAAFRDFWPYYLQEHAHAGTRAMHYAGTSLVVLLIAALPVAGSWWMIPAVPLAGYGFAWIGHSLIEHNRPATFRYPFWSLRADFVMWFRFLTGKMGRDLKRAGVRPDGSVDPALRREL
ncbi:MULTISPECIES: DUF962 domain-containing protein [Sphingobium]|jgi:hypothetical protein|uniref:DUF962 domain-containing protein n=1 Tax=Sphingobium fuliginis (strain ATCC 27551) TaxID=336203 RepID=A0A292ZIL0_SPHSA|nr:MULTISPECIES: DUF962 domain-containing protein [Sphingobium]QOT70825.1 DUF962 domain-containing protein [Sphingobium fuliginis]GAY23257.1 hypothetical protein SFOMI_3824 [Sphingobium fuliginis]